MYRKSKPMLKTKELIDHLKEKGVKFELISVEDAEQYLEENNNYFKLVSYRKNFPQYDYGKNEGKYINLDFKMLIDLSIIDMTLRKTMLSIVLDLEHYTKIKILTKIRETTNDGYSIVDDYMENLKNSGEYKYLEEELNQRRNSIYCGDLIEKYDKEYPLWVFLEIISFGRLIKFYYFIASKLGDRKMIDESFLLKDVRELRNACAHNNCILNDLKSHTSKYRPNLNMLNEIAQTGISKKIRDNKLSNARMKQLVTLLYLNRKITTSKGVLKHQTELLQYLKNRIERHINLYDKNELVQSNLLFLIKIIDNWYSNTL